MKSDKLSVKSFKDVVNEGDFVRLINEAVFKDSEFKAGDEFLVAGSVFVPQDENDLYSFRKLFYFQPITTTQVILSDAKNFEKVDKERAEVLNSLLVIEQME